MGKQIVNYQSKIFLDLVPCTQVQLCLADGWAAKTVSGYKLVNATVANVMRELGSLGMMGRPKWNVRGQHVAQYTFSIDDAQFLDDPETDDPYILDCKDIVGVNPFPCALDAVKEKLEDAIEAIETP